MVWQCTVVPEVKGHGRRGQMVRRFIRRRVGVVALVLLGVTLALALTLARQYHLGVAAILVGILGGLPGLYLAWAAVSSGPGGAGLLDLTAVADLLAAAVGEQWQAEATLRRLNDPYPLPVSWAAADPSVTDAWDSLVKLAGSGAGWPAQPPAGAWAAGPEGLAGAGGDLAGVLARVPTGRLVVLGEPGAGKSMLMVRLVLDLLARRAAGSPVPILVPVASWNPADQDLRSWLADELVIEHGALANPASASSEDTTQAAALLAAGLIVPILDGLDEILEGVRGLAVSRINDALRPGEQLVVTCRSQQYRDAVRPEGGVEVTLRGAAAVELRPLEADAVRDYLRDDAAGPVARARWDPVFRALGADSPAREALGSPLMVGLARAIYNPRPGELAGTLPDPAQLCSPALADRAAVGSLLLDEFIPAAYRDSPVGRWKAQDAERWLVFLARFAELKIAIPVLAWWDLPAAVAVPVRVLAAGVLIGVAAGAVAAIVAGVLVGVVAGVATGVAAGSLAGALAAGMSGGLAALSATLPSGPSNGIRWQPPSGGVVGVAAVAGAAAGAVAGVMRGFTAGVVAAVMVVAGSGLMGWLFTQKIYFLDYTSAASPGAVFARDRKAAIGAAVVAAFAWGSLLGVASWLLNGVKSGVEVGVGIGVAGGVTYGIYISAWPLYEIARLLLALRHQLPWPLMDFLADAHRRGVLRQAGAFYLFWHIELQHRLATRPPKLTGAP